MALLNEINVKGVPHPIVTDDGYYQEMTVGDAEQLVATTFTEDDTPYNFRTAGGAIDIGDRKQVEGIVGGTVAWNQLVQNGNFESASLWANGFHGTGLSIANGIATYTATGVYAQIASNFNNAFLANHVYMSLAVAKASTARKASLGTTALGQTYADIGTAYTMVGSVKKPSTSFTEAFIFAVSTAVDGDVINVKSLQCFDLTQMFGSTIADYIYSLEQATAGAGVAWFKKLFPKPYYAYNAGELMSVKTSEHKTVGFNQWDTSTDNVDKVIANDGSLVTNSSWSTSDYIKVVPNTTYYYKDVAPSSNQNTIAYYDADKNFVSLAGIGGGANYKTSGTKTTPQNAHFIRVVRFKTSNEVCINLSWDGERDGEYEEYVEHVYELDSDLELRGIPKLSAGNNLYYDGDVYEPDGTVTRKWGYIELDGSSDEAWDISGATSNNQYFINIADAKRVYEVKNNLVCNILPPINGSDGYNANNIVGVGLWPEAGQIRVSLDISTVNRDISAFKTWLSTHPLQIAYRKETPTTETADPYNGTQIVDDFGTEEFVDAGVVAETRDVAVPVGHNSLYQPNLRAKLEMAPESPEDNGYYVVYHHDGINEYTPLIIPQELPDMPTEDGTYTLKCTVASGSATLSFESEV